MADRFERILAILAKLETTEGTDASPAAATNAMLATNVTLTPLAGDDVSRDLMLPYLGHQGVQLLGNYIQMQFSVELAGSGAAGTPPAFGALLRGCGMKETVTEDTSVAYAPLSGSFESLSIYWIQDGVQHVALGARGTFTIDVAPKAIPHINFNILGLEGTVSDVTNPSADLSGFIDPVPVSKANTTLSLHGGAQIAESLSVDLGQTVTPRFLIGEEAMKISNRQAVGTAVVKAETMATKNWFSTALAGATGALSAVHGTAAGNIATIAAPKVQIGRPTQGATDGIINYSLPLMLRPDSGNDELTLTFT